MQISTIILFLMPRFVGVNSTTGLKHEVARGDTHKVKFQAGLTQLDPELGFNLYADFIHFSCRSK